MGFTVTLDTTALEDSIKTGLMRDGHIVARHALHFDQARQTGVVFHMISCITEHGRVGLTAVGDSPAQAEAIYQRAQRVLLDEAHEALKDSTIPV